MARKEFTMARSVTCNGWEGSAMTERGPIITRRGLVVTAPLINCHLFWLSVIKSKFWLGLEGW
ncbi:hypothetical protein TH606_10725 [Thermodesulfatator autotrophicus]|uniref:Uncharacterized protein n=1 Tax=Thermodesulfatator autotrophicus TaxID=1795632 RepID=A0A177E5M0_9BACT|nr:hypothetical protein TH606_10725 [Thermodesulfatator autotrophicus]